MDGKGVRTPSPSARPFPHLQQKRAGLVRTSMGIALTVSCLSMNIPSTSDFCDEKRRKKKEHSHQSHSRRGVLEGVFCAWARPVTDRPAGLPCRTPWQRVWCGPCSLQHALHCMAWARKKSAPAHRRCSRLTEHKKRQGVQVQTTL